MRSALNLAFVALFLQAAAFAADVSDVADSVLVKLSASGLCHPPISPYYNRVNSTKPGNYTLKQCLDEGNRLPQQLQRLRTASSLGDTAAEVEIKTKAAAAAEEERNKTEEQSRQFAGLRFGLGVGVSFLGPQIDEVRLIDNTIAVTEERSNQARVILESHKFVYTKAFDSSGSELGVGPFIAASLADEQGQGLLDSFGLGVMVGFRTQGSSTSWNLGIGWFVDTEVTQLRPGLADGMETSITDSADLTRQVDEEGLMIMISGSW